jgi:hypothetical protein
MNAQVQMLKIDEPISILDIHMLFNSVVHHDFLKICTEGLIAPILKMRIKEMPHIIRPL